MGVFQAMKKQLSSFSLILLTIFWNGWGRADSWDPPDVQVATSPSGKFRVIMAPRPISSAYDYFLGNADPPGQDQSLPQSRCELTLQKNVVETGTPLWLGVWRKPCVNAVSPLSVYVTDDGKRVVTFDNWHFQGYGNDVIAIYDEKGGLLKIYGLNDVLPKRLIKKMNTSASSIFWREYFPSFSNDLMTIIVGPDPNSRDKLILYLQDGRAEYKRSK